MPCKGDDIGSQENILITGASGFIGRHLLPLVLHEGITLSAMGRRTASFPFPVCQYMGDLLDRKFVDTCLRNAEPEIIFHLAAYKERSTDITSFYESLNINLLGTLNIFSSSLELPSLKAIVVIGTAEEYGNNICPYSEDMRELPVSPYSLSKTYVSHLSEIFFQLYDLPVVVLRPTLAYGPGQGTDMFLPSLMTSLLEDKPFNMTSGEQTRDFVYVTDLVEALILASQNTKAHGQIINIGSGIPIKLADIADKIENMIGKKGLVHLGGKPYRNNEIMEYYVEVKKAEDLLGWKAKTSIEEGLKETIAYYRGVKEL
jgi:nucleoside-diphosphate-sugar epimerase